jgi:cytochrome P450
MIDDPLVPIPPARPLPFLKALRVAQANTLAVIPREAYSAPVFDQSGVLGRSFLVSDPEAVGRVFLDNVGNYPKAAQPNRIFAAALGDGILASDGDTWRAHRRMMAPAFDTRSVEGYGPMMAAGVAEVSATWRAGQVIDVGESMADLSLRIISRAMFSGAGEALGPRMQTALRAVDAILADFGLADFVPGAGQWRARVRNRRIRQAFVTLDAWMMRLIARRREEPRAGDLLDRLLTARDSATGQGLDDRQVRDQLITLFVAGHETTAVAMTWTWRLLSRHPRVEARLQRELAASPDQPPAYARWVIEEAMRLFPPVPRIPLRQARTADTLCGVDIPEGAFVSVAPWVLHRHRRLWPEPEVFDPERFSPERSVGRPRFAYLPFGAGPRVCIGAALALSEAALILCGIARDWRLTPTEDPVAMKPRMTLRPLGPVRMRLETRRTGSDRRAVSDPGAPGNVV